MGHHPLKIKGDVRFEQGFAGNDRMGRRVARRKPVVTDYREQIDRLFVDSEGLEDGHTEVGLLEEAVRIAGHSCRCRNSGFESPKKNCSVRHWERAWPDQLLVAYSWCLAQVNKTRKVSHFRSLVGISMGSQRVDGLSPDWPGAD